MVCSCGLLGDMWYIEWCKVCETSCVGIFRVRVVLLFLSAVCLGCDWVCVECWQSCLVGVCGFSLLDVVWYFGCCKLCEMSCVVCGYVYIGYVCTWDGNVLGVMYLLQRWFYRCHG